MSKNIYKFLLSATIFTVALVLVFPSSSYAQRLLPQPKNFVATLTGKDMVPPVNTKASGIARFHMNSNGTLCYYIDVKNITGVIGNHIGFKNGTELADLLNPYADIATIGSYPQDQSMEFWEAEKLKHVEMLNHPLVQLVVYPDRYLERTSPI
jgi:hypothetical protein